MSISYKNLSKHPQSFQKLTGLRLTEFSRVVQKIRPEYVAWESKKKARGRPSGFKSLEDKLLCLIMYYRTYITHTFLGYLFNVYNANVCRMFKVLEPMIAKTLSIKKDCTLTQDKVMAILADVTEIPTQRPLRKQERKNATHSKVKSA